MEAQCEVASVVGAGFVMGGRLVFGASL